MRNGNRHLDEDQLVGALVDVGDLPKGPREHLSACPQCRDALGELEARLDCLSRMSQRMTPSPSTTMGFPAQEAPGRSAWSFCAWQPVAGAAFAAVLVIAVLWGAGLFQVGPDGRGHPAIHEEADPLIAEINFLAENPLPPLYLDLLGERDADVSEDLIRLLMPSEDEGQISFEKKNDALVKSRHPGENRGPEVL